MSIENVVRNRDALLIQVGKAGLNVKYPKEFEFYICALELIDDEGKTLRYFVFPVMPSTLDENKPKLSNIKKTLSGVTVLKTPAFVPTDINLSGSFGRKFRVLLGTEYTDFVSSFKDNGSVTRDSFKGGVKELFDERIKTGYGCTKILEEIIDQSTAIGEDGKLRKLILHNPASGNSYLVEPVNMKITQSEQTNMIWNYSLQLKSIAPLESLKTKREQESISKNLVVTGHIQKQVDRLINTVSALVANSEGRFNNLKPR
jgi:hypothetical protein